MGWKAVIFIHLTQDMNQKPIIAKATMNLRLTYNFLEFEWLSN
jgi:hypothetical protein